MTTSFSFVVAGKPQPKERARAGKNGRHYTPKSTRAYERLVRETACLYVPNGWQLDGAFRVDLVCTFDDYRCRDLDNCAKAVLDACNGIAWADDRQVMYLSMLKVLGADRPGVEVTVTRTGEMPSRGKK